jgi:hypothetical protein
LVMDFVDGPTLAHELARRTRLPVDEALGRGLEICEALAEAHRVGIVHRDIKPANLLLARAPDGSRVLRVADFGVAKAEGESTLTGDGASLGSPSYMAPEQIVDAHSVDARADLWAVGVVLYELIAGRRPFDGSSVAGTLLAVSHAQPARLDALESPNDVPSGVADVVARCLAKNADERYASAAALADALAALSGDAARTTAARIRRVGSAGEDAPRAVGSPGADVSRIADDFVGGTADPQAGDNWTATGAQTDLGSAPFDASASTVTGGITTPNVSELTDVAVAPFSAVSRRSLARWTAPAFALAALVALAGLLRARADAATDQPAAPVTPSRSTALALPISAVVPGRASAIVPPSAASGEIGDAPGLSAKSISADFPDKAGAPEHAGDAVGTGDAKRPTPTRMTEPVSAGVPAPPRASAAPVASGRAVPATELDDLGPRK